MEQLGHGIDLFLLAKKLYSYISQGDWEEVVQLWGRHPSLHSIGVTNSNETALHMAINEDREDIVQNLVQIVEYTNTIDALVAQNAEGETPLHSAAARGSRGMCDCIVQAGVRMGQHLELLRTRNIAGETPMYVAVLHNHKDTFISLVNAVRDPRSGEGEIPYDFLRKTDGDTVLHSAIRREHFDLAFNIIHLCPAEFWDNFNDSGETPLHDLAKTPSAFRSGYHASWWKRIIYFCIPVEPLKYDSGLTTTPDLTSLESKSPKIFSSCYSGMEEEEESAYPNKFGINENFPRNYATCYDFLVLVCTNFCYAIGLGKMFSDIKVEKEKHTWSVQILNQLLQKPSEKEKYTKLRMSDQVAVLPEEFDTPFKFGPKEKELAMAGDGYEDKTPKGTATVLVAAAKYGVTEIVDTILHRFPRIIPGVLENRNILMVAVEEKQPEIFLALQKHFTKVSANPNLWSKLLQEVDPQGNNLLHLAAKYDESQSPGWLIYGAAMQMNCEILWYEYVKSLLPSHYVFLENTNQRTPQQMFNDKHAKLVESSNNWLKDTSESCSVVAALVAGVSFATSSSLPGGTKEETGKPNLEGRPAFELFAVTSLIGLGFSVTALIMFLSILTSRKKAKDFMRDLPLKLLLGLSSLFVSIASMLISFCAAHFFVLEDQFKSGVFPLYAATCLPISFYAILQFPLYADLLQAIVTKVPHSQRQGHL